MNRRSFMKTLFALPVVAALPALWLKAKTVLGWKVWCEARVLNENWICVIHPSTEQALREIQARESWDAAWQAYRRAGRPEVADAREILDRFAPKDEIEHGRWRGVQFIATSKIA